MYDEDKQPKNYSQLAAIQLGWLMKDGAVAWKAEETAANGKDKGCFALALDKFPAAVKSLMTEVAQIKGKGDKARAEKLVEGVRRRDGRQEEGPRRDHGARAAVAEGELRLLRSSSTIDASRAMSRPQLRGPFVHPETR